jgi:hypothetical protein
MYKVKRIYKYNIHAFAYNCVILILKALAKRAQLTGIIKCHQVLWNTQQAARQITDFGIFHSNWSPLRVLQQV